MSQRRFGVGRRSPVRRLNGYEALLSAQIADGALGAWTMQETSGTTMLDLSGNGRHGTYTGVTLNQAPVLDIAARAAAMTAGKGEVAYAAWMNADYWTVEVAALNPTFQAIEMLACRDDGVLTQRQFQLRLEADKLGTIGWNSSGTLYTGATTTAVTAADEPHLYAMRWADGEMSGWVDGIEVLTVSTSGAARSVTRALEFGRLGAGSSPFDGRMSHAAYYGTALSDTQMLAHAQAAGLA